MSGIQSPDADATVVLIGPAGSDARCWQFLGLDGAETFELPGHGAQPRRAGWTYPDIADEIVARFDGPLHLVGASSGGRLALYVLTRHPERVRSAVIACAGPGTISALGRPEPALEGGVAAVVEETLTRWFTPLARRGPHAGLAYARQALLALDSPTWKDIDWANANSERASTAATAAIEQPVTIIAGMHDRVVDLAGSSALHQQIRRSRLEITTGPHMLHLERPENLLAALERHFAWSRTGNRVEAAIVCSGWPDVSIAQGQEA